MDVCSVAGCGRGVKALGLCGKHYQRLKIHGSTDDHLGCQVVDKVCSVDGCTDVYEARGLCQKHYARFKKHGSADASNWTHAPVEERFWRYVEKTDICWVWTGGSVNQKGYGQIGSGGKGGKYILAHRLSYQMHHGEIPEGLVVMHSCDNPSCVNPEHLSVGTQSQNILESFAKGRKVCKPPHVIGEAHGASKLKESEALEILKSQESTKAIAARYGVHKSAIERLRRGVTWKHLPRT